MVVPAACTGNLAGAIGGVWLRRLPAPLPAVKECNAVMLSPYNGVDYKQQKQPEGPTEETSLPLTSADIR
jgi:hypothetical protein